MTVSRTTLTKLVREAEKWREFRDTIRRVLDIPEPEEGDAPGGLNWSEIDFRQAIGEARQALGVGPNEFGPA